MTKMEAIKKYMGDQRPVTNGELLELAKADKTAFNWMGVECLKALGETETKVGE